MGASFDLRPLQLSELYARTARILRAAPAVILCCSILGAGAAEAWAFLILGDSLEWVTALRNVAVYVAVLGGTQALFGGIVALVVSDLYTGRRASFRSVGREIAEHGVPIFVTGALVAVSLLIGFAVLIFPGFLASLRWIYAAPVMAVERRYGRAALRRSSELGRARIESALMLVLTGLLLELLPLGLSGESWLSWLAALVVSAGSGALASTLVVVGYLDARTRSEGLSSETLAGQRAGWPHGGHGPSLGLDPLSEECGEWASGLGQARAGRLPPDAGQGCA